MTRTSQDRRRASRLLRHVRTCGSTATLVFAIQSAGALVVAESRPELAAAALTIAVLCGVLTAVGGCLTALLDRGPARAAALLAAVLLVDVVATAATIGVPPVHLALKVSFVAFGYGGTLVLALAAACASAVLAQEAARGELVAGARAVGSRSGARSGRRAA